MKNTIIIILAVVIIGGAIYAFMRGDTTEVTVTQEEGNGAEQTTGDDSTTVEDDTMTESDEEEMIEPEEVIGTSVEGRDITAYHFGDGDTELLFIGGIHGGYSWNTPLVAYELMDYLEANPETIPENVMVTVVPVLNPDGLFDVVGTTGRYTQADVSGVESVRVAGRFNANDIDLNRNFDCEWESEGTWQSRTVDGGSAPFSEPESAAMRDYVTGNEPAAVVVWYSAAGGVYSSTCQNGILPETTEITNIYASASGYSAFEEFDFYEITGDMVNWVAKNGIPGISVLLTTHDNTEWTKNRAGVDALLNYYAE